MTPRNVWILEQALKTLYRIESAKKPTRLQHQANKRKRNVTLKNDAPTLNNQLVSIGFR